MQQHPLRFVKGHTDFSDQWARIHADVSDDPAAGFPLFWVEIAIGTKKNPARGPSKTGQFRLELSGETGLLGFFDGGTLSDELTAEIGKLPCYDQLQEAVADAVHRFADLHAGG